MNNFSIQRKIHLRRACLILVSCAALQTALCSRAKAQVPASSTASDTAIVAATKTQKARIVVNSAQKLGRVPQFVFGQNIEAADTGGIFGATLPEVMRSGGGVWNPETRRPVPRVVQFSREIKTSVLRYPGGCLAHNFNWKKSVGPLAGRGDWKFGLDEYLELCRQVGATPLITVPDYEGTPQDAADLIEYLNAPATPAHPWAMKRAQWGHARPYGVRWFELGNESNHGNHDLQPHRQWTPEQYAAYANATGAAMRKVDPTIKLGIVTAAGMPVDDPWNAVVYKQAGKIADFVVVHLYPVNYGGEDADAPEDRIMRACMASGDQVEQALRRYHADIKSGSGRDLPIALSEYNIGFVQQKPKPFRFSYGAALFSADVLRIAMKPENNISIANYWQMFNGYWGALQGGGDNWKERPAAPLFRLWGRHFGTDLVGVQVSSPRQKFEGFGSTLPAQGATYQPASQSATANLASWDKAILPQSALISSTRNGDVVTFRLNNFHGLAYPNLLTIARPGTTSAAYNYRATFQARWIPDAGSPNMSMGLGMGDARGWEATHSAVAINGVENARDWKTFSGVLAAQADAPAITLLGRFEGGSPRVSGRMEVRNVRVVASRGEVFGAYALLTSSASTSADGKTLYLMVFNKSTDTDLDTTLSFPGFAAASVRRWTVNGPSLGAIEAGSVRQVESGVAVARAADGTWRHRFPAHSMTAIEVKRK